jgi:hypothetical protein
MASIKISTFGMDWSEPFLSSFASGLMGNNTPSQILHLAVSADDPLHNNFGENIQI